MNSPEQWKNALDAIEAFKEEVQKRPLSAEEKIMVLKEFVTIALQSPRKHAINDSAIAMPEAVNLTFAELLRKTKFKQHPDIVLLAVYDLMVNKNYTTVTTAEILKQYSDGLVKPSSNTSADVRQNRAKGFMMEADAKEGKMSFKITMSGIDYIKTVLKNDG